MPLRSLNRQTGSVSHTAPPGFGAFWNLPLTLRRRLIGSDDFPAQKRTGVEVKPLDFFLSSGRIPQPDLIKADVQGFELEVLKGAVQCLARVELLLIEVSYRQVYESAPLAHDVIAWAGAHGFRIYDICTYSQRPRDRELAQSDILFAAKDSKLFAYEGW